MAKNKKQRGSVQQSPAGNQPTRLVRILASDQYRRTHAAYSKRPEIMMALAEFIAFKRKNPTTQFGNKDKPFISAGPLRGYMHSGLNHDIQIVYTLSGKDPRIMVLHGIFSHDELGTGTPARINRQVNAAKSFANARDLRPLEKIDEKARPMSLILELLML